MPGQSGPNGSVRLNLGSVFYPQPVPVQATRYEPGAPAQLSSGYTGSGDAYATARAVPEDWAAKAGVDLLTAGDEPLLSVPTLPGAFTASPLHFPMRRSPRCPPMRRLAIRRYAAKQRPMVKWYVSVRWKIAKRRSCSWRFAGKAACLLP